MFNFLKNLFQAKAKEFFHGAILDPQEIIKDQPTFEEMVATANPVNWSPLNTAKLPNYPLRNQNGSSSCVAFTISLICSIIYFLRTGIWVDFSPKWVYSKRSNKPSLGMIGTNAFEIAQEGMLPDVLMPSDNQSEDQMNNPTIFAWFKLVADVFKLDIRLVVLPIKDIDTLASVIQTTGKPVMVWFEFGSGEWTEAPKILSSYVPWRHSVTAIPPSKIGEQTVGMYEGEKAFTIQDSWGPFLGTFNGKRIIKESFYKNRNLLAMYPIRFKFDAVDNKPLYDGTTKSLQDCLKYDGDFPTNIESTGFFGNITIESVKKFQAKYGIQQTGTVGPVTTAKLKELFGV